jgi:hypothetical protein
MYYKIRVVVVVVVVVQVQNEIRKKWQRHVTRSGGSWATQTQHSIGSFFRRSINRGDDNLVHVGCCYVIIITVIKISS